ncbi:MAG: hypothetical protein SNF33_00700 [Candidatus Algichlamydia australiensis]|nr:hypothetical protein [Chlamydiales bacterium]
MTTKCCEHQGAAENSLISEYSQDNELWNTGFTALTTLAGISAIGLQLFLCTSYSGIKTKKILQTTQITGASFGVVALVASKFFYPKHYPSKEESTCKICKQLTPLINQKIDCRRKNHTGLLTQGLIHLVGSKIIFENSSHFSSNLIKVSAVIALFITGFLSYCYLATNPNREKELDSITEKKIKDLTSTSS